MVLKTLEITLISAKDLKNVNLIGKMDVYVVVHLSDDTKNKQKTPVHQDSGTNPSWNYTMRFTIDDANASKPGKYVVFTLKHEQTFGSDKELGEVLVPLKELLDGVKDPTSPQFVTYQVRRVSSGKAQGELKLSYKFIDMGHNSGTHGKPTQCSSSSSSVPYPPPGGYGNFYPPPPHQAGAGVPYPPPHSHGSPAAAALPYPPPESHGKIYPPPQSHGSPAAAYPPPESHGSPAAAYPPPESHGKPSAAAVPYPPPESHGKPATGVPYPPPEGYPAQAHGAGVPYGAPQGYPPYGGYPPPPHATGGYGYPPPGGYPPHGGYPPPGGYPAYPPQQGYGQKPQKPKKNNLGMGLGAGLLGGALGGLVLGEVMDDAFDVDCDF